MLVRSVVASAVALLVVGKPEVERDYFEAQVKQAFLARDGAVDFSIFADADWQPLFEALLEQGLLLDREKPIDLNNLVFGNASEAEGGSRRRLQSWDRQGALDRHNEGRTDTAKGQAEDKYNGKWPQASNMNRLVWDDELQRVAQNYANRCIWAHNSQRNSQFNAGSASFETKGNVAIGENLAMGYRDTNDAITDGWYGEHKDGYWTTGSSCSGCGVIGHYTQMVWANTRYVGCGYSDCSGRRILVCNYYPAGNYGNQYAYKTGSPCTQCDADRNSNDCSDKQCGGCPNPSYAACGDYYSNCADLVKWCPSSCTDSSTDSLCTGCRNTCRTGQCPIDSRYTGSCSYSV